MWTSPGPTGWFLQSPVNSYMEILGFQLSPNIPFTSAFTSSARKEAAQGVTGTQEQSSELQKNTEGKARVAGTSIELGGPGWGAKVGGLANSLRLLPDGGLHTGSRCGCGMYGPAGCGENPSPPASSQAIGVHNSANRAPASPPLPASQQVH